jgi:hypothetical protein
MATRQYYTHEPILPPRFVHSQLDLFLLLSLDWILHERYDRRSFYGSGYSRILGDSSGCRWCGWVDGIGICDDAIE